MGDLWRQDSSLVESLIKSSTLPTLPSVPIDLSVLSPAYAGINSPTLPTAPIAALEYLWERFNLCQTLGVNGYSLQKLANDDSFAAITAARDVALGAFSSKYDDEKVRQEKLEPYQDKINVIKRDALCDYIIARQQELKFKDKNDLYAFFLLDAEMSGCFRTSRVVCAISSLQLYVHRILMNLEQSASDDDVVVLSQLTEIEKFRQEWEWRKNYRVWEANRKVFLYPENYTEPDLRDNKTHLFKELEDELLQEKITRESAEAAYKKYVSQFAELARLRIAGSYYHDDTKTYYFFGRTQQDPPQYHYRKWINNKVWTPWEKIELGIEAERVSALIHLGKLYLFWVDVKSQKRDKIENGTVTDLGHAYTVNLSFSYLNENGKWLPAQKVKLQLLSSNDKQTDQTGYLSKACFPDVYSDEIYLSYYDNYYTFASENDAGYTSSTVIQKLDLFRNELIGLNSIPSQLLIMNGTHLIRVEGSGTDSYLASLYTTSPIHEAQLDYGISRIGRSFPGVYRPVTSTPNQITNKFSFLKFSPELFNVNNKPGDFILRLGNQQFLITLTGIDEYWVSIEGFPRRNTYRISTALVDELGKILFSEGLQVLLSLDTQRRKEHPVGISFTNTSELLGPYNNPYHIDFKGAYGLYYRELFFHIPFLIASHLNANQKFEEAKWWYERIFDPTASESPDDKKPTDRNWRYIEFRDVDIEKLKDILTDPDSIEQYKENPFNPHAIARLRLGAYQKTIVMKYIDNLLDWGDHLFAQDTMESINEATMLYVLAADILGKRPVELGKCETAEDQDLTYERIGPEIEKGSEFLITLENWRWSNVVIAKAIEYRTAVALNSGSSTTDVAFAEVGSPTTRHSTTNAVIDSMGRTIVTPQYNVAPYTAVVTARAQYDEKVKGGEIWEDARERVRINLSLEQVKQSTLAFCVPPNYDLLKYWDRVEDRLFKIRHCMNISGVRRQLALFQPPIEPMALVRARAAGLSLEDILAMLSATLPPYRFSYLIEKAKQFTQTVQSFGNTLLSALEKKDVEELTLLRSVHERNILRITKEIKKQQISEAQHQFQAMIETETNVQNRINYYQSLLEAGLTDWEVTQQVSRHTATGLVIAKGALDLVAGILYVLPQIGSPFAMKYGGKEAGDSTANFADWLGDLANVAEAISASAGLEATFQRREQEWEQQLLVAQQELKQVEQQRLAAEVRQLIAEKDLEIHETNMEQADELHEFYKDKFTNLGLYNYLSTTLSRLYREAYNLAYDLAKMAERTYEFERDDETIFIAGDNWQFDRAGLLAGERLLLQLQRMEKAYLEQHTRDYEMTQSFSLALLNPLALLTLKQTGSCEFYIPEIVFDLSYPGQYKRLIKSVRLSIPCVTGPYTNISAKLLLVDSAVRKEASLDNTAFITIPNSKLTTTSIATSNAQNDGGLFELNFRDERYLPFEGAGAVSSWRLELPSMLRLFDYDTISDVIIHISYTAKDNGVFKDTVEGQVTNALTDFATTSGLYRLLSLRHEFPNAFHQLLNPTPGSAQSTEFEITERHFPYFLIDKAQQLRLSQDLTTVYLKLNAKEPVDITGLTMSINDIPVSGWRGFPVTSDTATTETDLMSGEVTLSGNPITIRPWTIDAGMDGLNKEKLEDILILLKYSIA